MVIPTLNEERYLPKLLKCLRAQLDKDFEVIVVDGSSEDKTVEKANGVKIILSKKRNVPYQRNLGAKEARGKWLVFLDADTMIPPNYLSEIHNYILINKTCALVTTWMKPDSKEKSDRLMVGVANVILEAARLTDKPFIPGFNIVVKKRMFNKVGGFNENAKLAEDHDLAKRLVEEGCELCVMRSPKITTSLRRFRREGKLEIMRKYAVATVKWLREGPITQEMFDYPMGGKV